MTQNINEHTIVGIGYARPKSVPKAPGEEAPEKKTDGKVIASQPGAGTTEIEAKSEVMPEKSKLEKKFKIKWDDEK